jgi:predicted lysophospholipase L1 biosynthesis ABC-type transport system permease subunit
MNEQDHLKTLSDIKTIMERSSRFLSLSGLSGVFIGLYALAGAIAAWWYADNNNIEITGYSNIAAASEAETYKPFLAFFIADALLVLFLSLLTGYVLTQRLARKQGLKIWDTAANRMLVNLLIPLAAGGAFCFILLRSYDIGLIAPSMLIFYGLALLNASKYTHSDIRYMGVLEIILGLVAAMIPGYGLVFWAIGFGIMHIVYGITMYYKYER